MLPSSMPTSTCLSCGARAALSTLLVAAGLGVGRPAAAQPARVPATADTGRAGAAAAALAELPGGARATLAGVLDSARAVGLPVAPLQGKVVEGVAKSASPEQIVAVVRRVADGLRTARQALGPGAREAELTAGGAAVQAGLTAEQLRRVRASLPRGRPATQALVVLTDLTRRGVPVADAVGAVGRLARAGAPDAAFAALRAQVADDVATGAPPRAAALRRADAMAGGRAPAQPPLVTPAPGPLDP